MQVTVAEMMAAREARAQMQRTLLSRYPGAVLVCLTMNIAGPVKTDAQIERAFDVFHQNAGSGKPTCILMRTIKGKGVSYMENNADWHGKAPNDKEYEAAMQELRAQLEELEAAQ